MTSRLVAALALALACAAATAQPRGLETAIFAGGCFWCVESDFDKVPGVVSTTSGYTGGHTEHPTYHQVSAGGTGHAESVEVVFDPKVVTYKQLLDYYWHSVDPTVKNRQFCDVGTQWKNPLEYHFYREGCGRDARLKKLWGSLAGQP
jgi:peptide-methionine (S)-S-oxide reductase